MICATKQHTGKTSVSLGLMAAARKGLAGSVGYMKPVGQTWVDVPRRCGHGFHRVDKDAAVAARFFGLGDCMSNVSPLVIERGFTKRYLDGELPSFDEAEVSTRLRSSFDAISRSNDFVIVEGTGHCGVGSVMNWSNARVAATLGIDVVLVANGGIGSTFDELSLNVMACRAENARIAGIVVNKVAPSKVDEVSKYLTLASKRFHWDVPVLACVPFAENLTPKMAADDQQAVRDVVDNYAPHLEQCVAHLFNGEQRAQRASVLAQQEPPVAAHGHVRRRPAASLWPQAMQQAHAMMDACVGLMQPRGASIPATSSA